MFFDSNDTVREHMLSSPEYAESSEGEVSTLNRLHQHCRKQVTEFPDRKSYVYYFHNKGACCMRNSKDPGDLAVVSWREVMNTFILEFPSICIRALQRGYVSCGVDYQDAHYSGNFWWADCHHVAALPPLNDRFDAYAAEFFIFNVALEDRRSKSAIMILFVIYFACSKLLCVVIFDTF